MSEQPKKITYLVNTKKSLALQFGGQDYTIPSGSVTIPELAAKLDVPEEKALLIAKHAARVYASYRPPVKPKEKTGPPQQWVRLESRLEPSEEPIEPIVEPSQDRVAVFQEIESEEPKLLDREAIFQYSLKDSN